jgi:hypothetical protein
MRKHRAADRLVIGVRTRHGTTDTTHRRHAATCSRGGAFADPVSRRIRSELAARVARAPACAATCS